MTREILPTRRFAETFDVIFRGVQLIVTFSRSPIDGRVIEIFASPKIRSSDFDNDLCDSCVSVSIALQSGAQLSDLRKSMLRARNGRPAGVLGCLLDEIDLRAMVPDSEAAE